MAGIDVSDAPNSGFGFPATIDTALARGTDATGTGINDGWYWRVRDGGTISKVSLEVAVSSGNVSVAAYRNSGSGRSAVPGTRLATSGAVACPAVGYAEISLGAAITLMPGDWLGLSVDNATATFRCMLSGFALVALGTGRSYVQTSAHPLPATPSSLTAAVGKNIVLVGAP